MFWGLAMEPQKRYTQTVTESFHISQAALDVTGLQQESSPTQVVLDLDDASILLATLSKSMKILQVPLDLNFQKGDSISLRSVGPATIHLSGYHVIDEDEDDLAARLMGGPDSEDEEIEDEEDEDLDSSIEMSGKRKKQLKQGSNKKSKIEAESSSDEDEDPSMTSFGDSTLAELEAEDDSDLDSDADGEEEEEEEDDSDEGESDSEEEEVQVKPIMYDRKKDKNTVVNGSGTPKGDKKEKAQTPKSEKKANKELNQTFENNKTPKQDKKNKKDGKTPKVEAQTPKQDKATPKQEKKTPSNASPNKRTLEGGVIVEELKNGEGPVAKSGKFVQVYYVGKLKSNGKQFDATTSGPGFKFRLGRSEVIKGWDVGVQGMKVGGKRRLTIPAPMAYGAKGSLPVIPPNATLSFDVELRGVS